jgi:hypothetical protein
MPYEGHEYECFSVHLHRFCYSDYMAVPGFRNTASHGGPIRPGIAVRVTYVGASILRLEIAKGDMPASDQSKAAAKLAQSQWETRIQNDHVQQFVMTAFLLTGVLWTLWWNVQWKRVMRFWLRPPYRRSTENVFRIFFGLNLAGALFELVQQLRRHPLTQENALPTLTTAAIMCLVVGTGSGLVLWAAARRDRTPRGV